MGQMGDWMLPGAALVVLVIAGIVLVAFDDIVAGLLRLGRKRARPAVAGDGGNVRPGAQSRRRKRLRLKH
jgi:hypothetical protein